MPGTTAFDNDDLFDDDGHLTDSGLLALTENRLDDLGRLEAAEHLSFCEDCLPRYTVLAEALPTCMQKPMLELVSQIQTLMRRRSFRVFTNRYFSAAAAVVLAFVLWSAGVFGDSTVAVVNPQPSFSAQASSWVEDVCLAFEHAGASIDATFEKLQSFSDQSLAQIVSKDTTREGDIIK